MSKRNGLVGFWKFMYALMIVVYHGAPFVNGGNFAFFRNGYLAVEFFFIISGFYLAKQVDNNKNDTNKLGVETFELIVGKIKKYLPLVLIAWLIGLFINFIYYDMNFYKFFTSFFDLFFLRMSGLKTFVINGPLWYLSAMLIVMLLLYPLLRKHNDKFSLIICPLIFILGYGYLNAHYSNLNLYSNEWLGPIFIGLFRALCGMCFGIFISYLSSRYKDIKLTKFGKMFNFIFSSILLGIPFIVSTIVKQPAQFDYVLLLSIGFGILIITDESKVLFSFSNNKIFMYLERFSMVLFINHWNCRLVLLKVLNKDAGYITNLLVYVLSAIFICVIIDFIANNKKVKYFFKIIKDRVNDLYFER
ncbi:MAG: acyltransferase [Bacilli bacterium]|nr:acyltransferase [Bacilli bacterium]